MNPQIASTVELLQAARPANSKSNPGVAPYPDPLTLLLLFREAQPSLPGQDMPARGSENPAVSLTTRKLTVTQGNVNNSHIYLTPIMSLFPADVMGGENEAHAAAKTLRIHWGDEHIDTDIVRAKHIFRRRGWVRKFFEAHRIEAGDQVCLEQLGAYLYRISKA